MIIWYGNIDNLRKIFWKDFDNQNFLWTLNYDFFPFTPFFNESNNLESYISNSSSP
jgi:hypothetical protein